MVIFGCTAVDASKYIVVDSMNGTDDGIVGVSTLHYSYENETITIISFFERFSY